MKDHLLGYIGILISVLLIVGLGLLPMKPAGVSDINFVFLWPYFVLEN